MGESTPGFGFEAYAGTQLDLYLLVRGEGYTHMVELWTHQPEMNYAEVFFVGDPPSEAALRAGDVDGAVVVRTFHHPDPCFQVARLNAEQFRTWIASIKGWSSENSGKLIPTGFTRAA